jgi:hypothetical protein
MPTFAKKQPKPQQKRLTACQAQARAGAAAPAPDLHAILQLQQTIGNQAVLRRLGRAAETGLPITPTPGVQVARTTDAEHDAALAQAARELDELLRDEGLLDLVREADPRIGRVTRVPPAEAEAALEQVIRGTEGADPKSETGVRNAHAKDFLNRLRDIRARQRKHSPLNRNKPEYKGKSANEDPKKPDTGNKKPPTKGDTPSTSTTKGDSGSKTPKVTPQVTPKPSQLPKVSGLKPKFAKALSGIRSSAARAIKLAGRLSGFVTVLGHLLSVLDALEAIETITDLLAHGTAMPKEQAEANKIERDSNEAKREAEAIDEDISYAALSILINEAAHSGDDQALLALTDTLIAMRQSLRATAGEFTGISVELTDQAREVKTEISERFQSIIKPGATTTAGAGHAIIMAESLKKLHATITSAADNFTTAAKTLTNLADELEPFETVANNATWDVRQKRAATKAR